MAKKYDKEKLIFEWKTGRYTQRELAHTYKISNGMVAKIVKDIKKESEQLVSNLVNDKHALKNKSEQEQDIINNLVSKELARKERNEKTGLYLDRGVDIAVKKGVEILQGDDASMDDVMKFGKFQNDARVGLDLQPKFSTTPLVTNNNTNAQQNNDTTIQIEFVE